ncbi:hypothetical protein ABZ484_04310 [Streptomyces sp. NPDC006393]|uniref:hypothetical protein n=1 Tax=Streptomyces sp. NPDC006393 TaxID=3156763 RepID=UPI0033E85110
MRSVFVFPAGERAETIVLLDQHLPQQRGPWTLDGNLCIDIDDEETGHPAGTSRPAATRRSWTASRKPTPKPTCSGCRQRSCSSLISCSSATITKRRWPHDGTTRLVQWTTAPGWASMRGGNQDSQYETRPSEGQGSAVVEKSHDQSAGDRRGEQQTVMACQRAAQQGFDASEEQLPAGGRYEGGRG